MTRCMDRRASASQAAACRRQCATRSSSPRATSSHSGKRVHSAARRTTLPVLGLRSRTISPLRSSDVAARERVASATTRHRSRCFVAAGPPRRPPGGRVAANNTRTASSRWMTPPARASSSRMARSTRPRRDGGDVSAAASPRTRAGDCRLVAKLSRCAARVVKGGIPNFRSELPVRPVTPRETSRRRARCCTQTWSAQPLQPSFLCSTLGGRAPRVSSRPSTVHRGHRRRPLSLQSEPRSLATSSWDRTRTAWSGHHLTVDHDERRPAENLRVIARVGVVEDQVGW